MSNDSSSRIVEDLRRWIASAAPGARLPSTRVLAAKHQASPITVQKAMRQLTTLGLIESRPGVGTFVRTVRATRPADFGWQTAALGIPRSPGRPRPTALRTTTNDVIALHSGYPDPELLPERLVRAALTRAARGRTAVSQPPASGLPDLQSWFAQELASVTPRGVTPPSAGDVVVLPGSQSGLSSLFRALVTPGQPLLMESPTYWGAIAAAVQTGVPVVPVPAGPGGPEPDELDRAFTQSGARVLYAQPNYTNPTGAQWSPQRADEILDIVRAHGAFLIEDDWAHDFGITTSSRPLAAHDDAGHVVYLRSLTKSVSPAIRIAGLVARGPARERILSDRAAESMYVSGVLQVAALDVITHPSWQTQLRGLRHHLRARRDLLVESLGSQGPDVYLDEVPPGGLNLWVRLPDGTDAERLARRCEALGLLVAPGREWFPAEPTGSYLRLNFAGPNPAAFPDGIRILSRAMQTRDD